MEDPEVLECARYGELDELRALLEGGASVNVRDAGGNSALHKVAANGNLEIAELLVRTFSAVHAANASGNTPLHWACLNGHKAIVELLLSAFADIDVYAKNSFGRSAFTEALSAGHDEIGRLLLTSPSADPARAQRAGGGSGAGAECEGGVVEEEEDLLEGDEDEALVEEPAEGGEGQSDAPEA
jgi:ankyrin repeat protein